MFQRLLTALLLLLLSSPLSAAYITDKLLAGFYEEPEAGVAPLQLLPSGTPVELLKTEGSYTQVRLPDRKEGWVESHYISNEKPAQVMLLELQAVAGGLRHKLQQAGVGLEQSEAGSSDQTTLQAKLAEAEKQVKELTQELQSAKGEQVNGLSLSSLPLWVTPVAGLLVLLGFISGIIFRNFRLSRRFGGHKL